MPTRTGLIGLSLVLMGASAAAGQGVPPGLAFSLHLHCVGHLASPPPPQHAAGAAPVAPAAPVIKEVFVDIDGDQGRVRLPASPGVNGVAWAPIVGILVDESQVTGHVALDPWTFWNRPLMRVDRVGGGIDLAVPKTPGFHGGCAAYDPSEMQRF